MTVRILPGTSDFAKLRRLGGCYVDKTYFLKQFLSSPLEVTLFTRPRRFGKSMTLSMMAHFLDIREQGTENLFDGLEVTKGQDGEDLCARWMHRHPVLLLSLKGIEATNYGDALSDLQARIKGLCIKHGYLCQSPKVSRGLKLTLDDLICRRASVGDLKGALQTLSWALAEHHGRESVILVDEYDAPVTKSRQHGYYESMIVFVSGLLEAAFKENDFLNFGIVTGGMRIVKESVFTGFNNFTCHDISKPKYSDVFGFTSEEVDAVLEAVGLKHRREEIREWYNGYRFGGRQAMYCPWDIMEHVEALQSDQDETPQCYWEHVTSNAVIGDFVRKMRPRVEGRMIALRGGGTVSATVRDSLNYRELDSTQDPESVAENFWTLLYHAGYLTMAPAEGGNSHGAAPSRSMRLRIPNREIATIFDRELRPLFAAILAEADRTALIGAFWEMDEEKLQRELSRLTAKVGHHSREERFFHGLVSGILYMQCDDVGFDRQGGSGRYDILVVDKGREAALVIEIKRTRDPDRLDALTGQALVQIAEKGYDAEVDRAKYPTVIHWGLAFCGHRCAVKAHDASEPGDAPRPGR